MNVQIKKQKALDFFLTRLLETEVGRSIAKVVLFGSLLKDKAKEDSDIDLLVITTDSVKKVSLACAETSFETAMATGESVEPLIRCIDEVRHPQSYFIYSAFNRGREIYSMNEKELKRKEAQNYLDLAAEYLDGSIANLQRSCFRIAVDAAYNGCELAVKGMLLLKLPDIPSSHGGIVNKFGLLFVKTEDVPKEIGRNLHLALEMRNNARYEPHAQITKDQADLIINLAKQLQALLEKQIET